MERGKACRSRRIEPAAEDETGSKNVEADFANGSLNEML